MRTSIVTILIAVAALGAAPALAELQNVTVGGEVRIKTDIITNWIVDNAPVELRIPAGFMPKRPIGDFILANPIFNGLGVVSPYAWSKVNDANWTEQRTRLHVAADFTDGVGAFVELEAYNFWGDNFRSDYVTGADNRAGTNVTLYQAYIEAKEMYGLPLSLRVGRQELAFGSQWLVGPKDFGPNYTGRSFDALKLTYATDLFKVDAFASKLFEGGTVEQDGDVDFYGLYASFLGIEDISIDAYWFLLRDARRLSDTNLVWFGEWVENVLKLDDYDVSNLHTVGMRGAGKIGGFDFDADVAYQFGDADSVGYHFKPFQYGDNRAEFDAWGCNLNVGYTFDIAMQPRLHLGYSFYQGADNRDLTFWEWLNPFHRPEASVSFNRLFSNKMASGFLDLMNDYSNGHIFVTDVMAHPTESVTVIAGLTYYLADEAFAEPYYVKLGRYHIPIMPSWSFWTKESSRDLGLQSDIIIVYAYSKDLTTSFHWCHLFTGDGLKDGNYNAWNGLMFDGGREGKDGDFFSLETCLKF